MRKILFIFAAVLLSSIGLHAGNTITYTASSKLSGYYSSLSVGATTFGPAIISHEFFNGTGTIVCNGEITTIGKSAFDGCYDLKDITLPNSVTTIGEYAFWKCSNLSSVTIPNSVTEIGRSAFRYCGDLVSVTIGNSVRTFGDGAFGSDFSLTSVIVNWTDAQLIPSINSNVFEGIANEAGPAGATLHVPEGTYNLYNQANVWKDFIIAVHNSTITYTASEKLPGYDGSLNVGSTTFGPAIISHEFFNGKGTIVCNGEITKIGKDAFYKCKNLTSVTIPNSVTTIGEYSFYSCTSLKNVTIPNSVTTIGKQAFYVCSGLTSITIPQSVTTIEEQAFEGSSTSLTSIVVESGNPKYDSRDNCNAIIEKATNTLILGCKNTKIPNNIITIGRSAFDGCYDLKDITLPNSVTTIGRSAFWECKNLTSITIPNAVTTIGINAFAGAGLTSITIPASVKEINEHAFWDCTGLKELNFADRTDAIIIGTYAFENMAVTEVSIPDWMTVIPEGLFYANSKLEAIYLPESVKSINSRSFEDCTGLSSVTVAWTDAQSIPSINSNVFQGIANGAGLASATLYVPGGTANLYQQADVWKDFGKIIDANNCKITYTASEKLGYNSLNVGSTTFGPAITSHEFSNGTGTITCSGEITTIGDNAFKGAKLTSVIIPNTVTRVGHYAFCGSGLLSIVIPDFVTSIGMEAFGGCTSLTVMTIGQSVKELLWTALWNCWALKTIYCFPLNPPFLDVDIFRGIPREGLSVYVLDVKAYSDQSAWGSQLPASCFKPISAEVGDFKYEFFDGNKARVIAKEGSYTGYIAIPEQVVYRNMTFTVTEIGQSAFKNCTGLTSVIIPKSVTTIGMDAFWQCSNLSSVTIPNSVTTIGQSAFFETGLTSVTIPASVKEIGTWAFKNCTQLKDLQFAERTDAINIGTYAFENMALDEVVIPDWMTAIPDGLFYSNKQLKGIYLHEGVNTIGYRPFGACPFEYIISMSQMPPTLADGAFEGHNKDDKVIVYVPSNDAVVAYQNSDWNKYFINSNFITNNTYRITSSSTAELVSVIPEEKIIAIPTMVAISGSFYQVIGIGNNAFKDNTVLESISLPPTIKYIGANAFDGCTKLKQTNSRFWGDLQTIGAFAFYGCTSLDSIVIPEGVQSIGNGAFKECRSLKYVSLPGSLRTIPDECFRFCYLVGEIIIPEGVETIGQSAFEGTAEIVSKELVISLPSTLKEINLAAFFWHNWLKGVTCLATTPPTLKGQAFVEYQYQEHKDEPITVYVPNRDVLPAYRDDTTQWGSKIYKFKFSDLMAEENKQYLYTVAGDNEEAKAIASAYCDSIDNYANNSEDVQQYTNTALGKIDKITLAAYKQNLIDSLANYAKSKGENIQAQQIAEQYAPQIRNAYFRQDAEQLFTEAMKKITDIFELIDLKKDYKEQLVKLADGDNDLLKVATDYGALIERAETKDEAYDLYTRAQMRIEANRQIKNDWTGQPSQKAPLKCSTTRGYIDNH